MRGDEMGQSWLPRPRAGLRGGLRASHCARLRAGRCTRIRAGLHAGRCTSLRAGRCTSLRAGRCARLRARLRRRCLRGLCAGSSGAAQPTCSSARPAADRPSGPAVASTSPGRAPERVTGSRPCRSPRAVTASSTLLNRAVSPRPPTPQPGPPRRRAPRPPPAPTTRAARRGSERDEQRGRGGPHGRDIGQAADRSTVPDVRWPGPVAAEVPPLQQEIRGRDDPAVGGGEHGGVVPDPDDRARSRPHSGCHLRDEAELTQLGDAAVSCLDDGLPAPCPNRGSPSVQAISTSEGSSP